MVFNLAMCQSFASLHIVKWSTLQYLHEFFVDAIVGNTPTDHEKMPHIWMKRYNLDEKVYNHPHVVSSLLRKSGITRITMAASITVHPS